MAKKAKKRSARKAAKKAKRKAAKPKIDPAKDYKVTLTDGSALMVNGRGWLAKRDLFKGRVKSIREA